MKRARGYVEQFLEAVRIDRPKVKLSEVAEHLGIKIHRMSWPDDLCGAICIHDDGSATVGVNQHHHVHRQRFTAAHELGHFVLHADKSTQRHDLVGSIFFRTHGTNADKIEREANEFAAELLMPHFMLKRDAEELPEEDFTASFLAQRYGVSEQAMTIRLSKLRL